MISQAARTRILLVTSCLMYFAFKQGKEKREKKGRRGKCRSVDLEIFVINIFKKPPYSPLP